MTLKLVILLLFIGISGRSHAQTEICEDNELIQMAKSLSYPNCNTPINIQNFQLGKTKELCEECKPKFEKILDKKIGESQKLIQEDFFQASLQEYKKNLINNLLTAIKLRPLHNTGSNFKKAIASCRMRSFDDLAKNCKSPKAISLLKSSKLFNDMSAEVANDLAKIVSTEDGFDPKPTLLTRTPNACFIPESEIMRLSNSANEEMLSEKLITALKGIDITKYKSVSEIFASDEAFDNYEGDLNELRESLNTHPLISQYLHSPEKFITFLKEIPTPPNTLNLRKKLYSSENKDSYDETMASSCEKSITNFEKSICSEDFEKGNIFLDPSANYNKLNVAKNKPSEEALAATDELFTSNIQLLSYCESKKTNSLNLTSINEKISDSLDNKQRSQTLESYSSQKYNTDIGTITKSLCAMTDDKCVEGTSICNMYKNYKASKDKSSTEAKLAGSSNQEVNALLRSMLGDTSKISGKTKEILVANGIIPKDDGTIVAQPTIPERQPDYFAKVPQPAAKPTAFAPSSTERKTASSQNAARQYDGPDYTQTSFQNLKSPSNVDFKDLVDDSTQDLKDIQNEIRRRLTDLGPSKVNKAQAQKIVKESFAASGKTPTPVQETNYTNRILNSVAQEASAAAETQPVAVAGIGADTSATGSTTKAWREAQKNEALAGMAGAQAVSAREILDAKAAAAAAAAAADPAAKPLTNVALSIAEDPRVSLSDVLNDKINRNDSETQLLKVLVRNKQPFMLKVKDLNFKVIFDNSQPKILLESGDKKEAERLRPQLELFFNKLRSNSIYVIR